MARNKPSALSKLSGRDDFAPTQEGRYEQKQPPAHNSTYELDTEFNHPVKSGPISTRSPLNRVVNPDVIKTSQVAAEGDPEYSLEISSPKRKINNPFEILRKKKQTAYVTTDENTAAPTTVNDDSFGNETFDYSDFEKQLDTDDIIRARKRIRREKRTRVLNQMLTVLLILGCLYLIFLIYGAWNTQYVYDDNGMVVPQVLTAEQIGALAEFNSIANVYRQARMVYEDVLLLDYRIAAGMEDTLLIAPEYEKELELIEQLAIQCQGMSVQAEYTQIHTMLTAWVSNDIAIYCQRMSSAISQNNSTYAQQALEYKQICYNDFSLITENLSTIGDTVYGAEIGDIVDWSPESFINETIGTIGGEVIG